MEAELHFLIGGVLLLFLSISLVISQYKGRIPVYGLREPKREAEKQERRIYPRYKTSLRIKYKTPFAEGISWVKDISKGGIRIFIDNTLEMDGLLRLEITLPYDRKPVFAQSSIVWTKEDDAGLSFEEVKQEDLNRIFEYILHKKQVIGDV